MKDEGLYVIHIIEASARIASYTKGDKSLFMTSELVHDAVIKNLANLAESTQHISEETKATLAEIQASGVCWCGGAVWQNEPVIRVSVCSWRTTHADVERSVEAFAEARDLARKNFSAEG